MAFVIKKGNRNFWGFFRRGERHISALPRPPTPDLKSEIFVKSSEKWPKRALKIAKRAGKLDSFWGHHFSERTQSQPIECQASKWLREELSFTSVTKIEKKSQRQSNYSPKTERFFSNADGPFFLLSQNGKISKQQFEKKKKRFSEFDSCCGFNSIFSVSCGERKQLKARGRRNGQTDFKTDFKTDFLVKKDVLPSNSLFFCWDF